MYVLCDKFMFAVNNIPFFPRIYKLDYFSSFLLDIFNKSYGTGIINSWLLLFSLFKDKVFCALLVFKNRNRLDKNS